MNLFLKYEYKTLSYAFIIFFKFFFIFDIIKTQITECPKDKPILVS